MQTTNRSREFMISELGLESADLLKLMVQDTSYNTDPSYSSDTDRYPDNLMPFFDKHMEYLSNHTQINPQLYLSNLRLMTRIRVSSPS